MWKWRAQWFAISFNSSFCVDNWHLRLYSIFHRKLDHICCNKFLLQVLVLVHIRLDFQSASSWPSLSYIGPLQFSSYFQLLVWVVLEYRLVLELFLGQDCVPLQTLQTILIQLQVPLKLSLLPSLLRVVALFWQFLALHLVNLIIGEPSVFSEVILLLQPLSIHHRRTQFLVGDIIKERVPYDDLLHSTMALVSLIPLVLSSKALHLLLHLRLYEYWVRWLLGFANSHYYID